MIKAIIFDMDGVLLDSEPLWRKAEIKVFGTVGLEMTEEMCLQTTGMRIDEVVAHWYAWQAWEGKSLMEIETEILDEMENFIRQHAVPMQGVMSLLELLDKKGIPLAVASSSPLRLIHAVMDRFGIRDKFQVLSSAENEAFGKPHPGVYLRTARLLGVAPENCLSIEDSFNGLLSAKSAQMKTIVIPEGAAWQESRFDLADLKLKSLVQLDEACLDRIFRDF